MFKLILIFFLLVQSLLYANPISDRQELMRDYNKLMRAANNLIRENEINDDLASIYEEIEGWNEDITQIDNYHDLPDNFKKYVTFLEKNLELEIKIVSVGPNRKQTIIR